MRVVRQVLGLGRQIGGRRGLRQECQPPLLLLLFLPQPFALPVHYTLVAVLKYTFDHFGT